MKTNRRSTLLAGLAALLLLLSWALTMGGLREQPMHAPAAQAPAQEDSKPAVSITPAALEVARESASAPTEASSSSPDSAVLEMRLLDAEGAPARGAEAWLEYSWERDPLDGFPFPLELPSGSGSASTELASAHVHSDPGGRIRLGGIQAGRDLVLYAGGEHWRASPRRIAPLRAGELRELGTISVLPAARIFGRILDPEGRPLPRAVAEIRSLEGRTTGPGAEQDSLTTHSKADGSFEFAGLPDGSYELRGSAAGFGVAILDPVIVPKNGQDVSVDLHLPAGIPIHGRILDANLEPLATARVLLAQRNTSVADILEAGIPVDAEGRFVLGAPADLGALQLLAAAPDHARGATEVLTHDRPIELVLDPVVRVTGRVVDASRAPVAEALLRLRALTGEPRLATSAADGSFEFAEVAPGDYCIEASAASGSAAIPSLLVTPDLVPVELRLFGGPGVEITVYGPDAEPLEGALVELFPEPAWADEVEMAREASASEAPPEADMEGLAPVGQPTTESLDAVLHPDEPASALEAPFLVALPRRGSTDENGKVLLLDVPSGTWEAQISSPGFLDGTLYFERDDEEFLEQLSVKLERSCELRVSVVGPGGDPVPDTDIVLRREAASSDEEARGALLGMRTDAGGLAVWRNPPPGDYTLHAQVMASSGQAETATTRFSSESLAIHLEPGTTVEERLELRSLCLPTVRVTQRGVPVAGAEVSVHPGDLRTEEALLASFEAARREARVTDATGKVVLHACTPGLLTFAASAPGIAPATLRQVDVKPGAQSVEIQLAEGQIAGRVEDANGPLPGAEVTLLPALESRHASGADSDGSESTEQTTGLDEVDGRDRVHCTTRCDASGNFLIDAVPRGRYCIRVDTPRPLPWLSKPFDHDGTQRMELGTIRF
jgi:protocatechuate 3,4-dioxygenase beta subunit